MLRHLNGRDLVEFAISRNLPVVTKEDLRGNTRGFTGIIAVLLALAREGHTCSLCSIVLFSLGLFRLVMFIVV